MAEGAGFGDRLVEAVRATTPLCVGIDPSAALLERWGLDDSAAGVEAMARTVIDAVVGTAAAIKPQVAYFERHGTRGYAALEAVIAAAGDAGILVVADAKRGDIDATMAAYGEAWLSDGSPLAVDALTVSAYLGLGAMDQVAVVGATRTAGTLALGDLVGPFLVPGVGAQGATAADVGALFSGCPQGSVLVNASRSILAAGPSGVEVARAARELGDELRSALV